MQLQKQSILPDFTHTMLNGEEFSSKQLKGKKTLITFFRFATCPFCNLRLHQLISKSKEWGDEVQVVAFFESPLKTLQKHQSDEDAPFSILSDSQRVSYKKFGIVKSFWGMTKGIIFRFPTIVKGMVAGYIPRGMSTTIPASFLVDENLIIQEVYYGKDEGDHIDITIVEEFFKKSK